MRSLEPRITCPLRAWGPQRSPISLSLSAPYYVVVAWLASTLLPLPLDSSRPSSVVSLHHHHHLPFSPTRLHCSTPLSLSLSLSTQLTYSPRNRAIKASTHGGRLDEIDPPSRIDRSEMMMDSAEHHKVIAITPAAEAGRPCCVECRTTATPMWRGGPTGPRSLCNACGIRYRKKRRQELGLDTTKKPQQNQQLPLPQPQQQQQQHQHQVHSPATSAVVKDNNKSSNLQVVKKRRVLMGVEEAAILLMALSSSSRSTLLHG